MRTAFLAAHPCRLPCYLDPNLAVRPLANPHATHTVHLPMPVRPSSTPRSDALSLRRLLGYYTLSMLGIALFAAAPLLLAIGAGTVASQFGCQVDEGSPHACWILGWDAGPTFYRLGVMGWYMLVTLPAGAVSMLVATGLLVVHLIRRVQVGASR
ncbi:hypothetical protein ACQKO6_01195 [Pseudomonas monteilii]|uniref:hypothetical protein n=1 Tax=Pseudomonas alabamensis TaxID=3064349 RepID=UPI00272C183D|nr:hypothetical protein [Pseudomonas sp. 22-AL-CL-001]